MELLKATVIFQTTVMIKNCYLLLAVYNRPDTELESISTSSFHPLNNL